MYFEGPQTRGAKEDDLPKDIVFLHCGFESTSNRNAWWAENGIISVSQVLT